MQLTSLEDINTSHRQIFLSPHFDDAVYSCGGTLAVQVSVGLRPLVITVFGGVPEADTPLSPFAMDIHRQMGFSQDASAALQTRRKEEAAAMEYLDVDYLWLDYPDAIYRGNPAYYTNNNQLIGGEVNPGDRWIDEELAEILVSLHQRLPDTVWYAPLAIGRHIDHQIVCSAADRLTQLGAKVNLFEDFPYCARHPHALLERLEEFGNQLEPGLVEVDQMLPQRLEASAKYTSQIDLNFADKASMFKEMRDYTYSIRPVETVHLERYWSAR
ncbi:MAG TPA: PIG-L family deacetylase [Ktedonobacteraceae bacterium]